MAKFYITTAIPYVNAKPHIGHALEYFQADTIRRYREILGDNTLLLSGADENALKNVQAAEKEGVQIQQFLDRNSEVFRKTYERLGIKLDVFQRGSDQKNHWPGVKKLWNLCDKAGDIYKKSYAGLYCVGCESFKTKKELVNGLCPEHQKKPEKVTEENYFFRLFKYQDKLLQLIESNELKITPDNKRAEIVSFVKGGLEDFSVSRSKERAKGVGVPVPNDPDQIIYVWFDALAVYLTGIGFGSAEQNDIEKYNKWWPADLHVIGKDINRFHTVYWPTMLLSAGLPLPKEVLVHSFVNSSGQKMSKSLGNVIDPFEMIDKYGLESVRYYLLSQIPIDSDGDFSEKRFKEVYNADLANGLGNLVARVAKLCETTQYHQMESSSKEYGHLISIEEYSKALSEFRFNDALSFIWEKITELDRFINDERPWELLKGSRLKVKSSKLNRILGHAVDQIQEIAVLLEPFLPETAKKIENQFKGPKITSQKPLFPRI
jgi:methionyl-tRNA synthetase